MNPSSTAPAPARTARLWLVPGRLLLLLFAVPEGNPPVCLALPPSQLLEGLQAACAVLGLGALHRAEPSPEELLPWAGNV